MHGGDQGEEHVEGEAGQEHPRYLVVVVMIMMMVMMMMMMMMVMVMVMMVMMVMMVIGHEEVEVLLGGVGENHRGSIALSH